MSYLSLLERTLELLTGNPEAGSITVRTGRPLSGKALKIIESKTRQPMPSDIREFYEEMNGLIVSWNAGHFEVVPAEVMFGGYNRRRKHWDENTFKDIFWFDHFENNLDLFKRVKLIESIGGASQDVVVDVTRKDCPVFYISRWDIIPLMKSFKRYLHWSIATLGLKGYRYVLLPEWSQEDQKDFNLRLNELFFDSREVFRYRVSPKIKRLQKKITKKVTDSRVQYRQDAWYAKNSRGVILSEEGSQRQVRFDIGVIAKVRAVDLAPVPRGSDSYEQLRVNPDKLLTLDSRQIRKTISKICQNENTGNRGLDFKIRAQSSLLVAIVNRERDYEKGIHRIFTPLNTLLLASQTEKLLRLNGRSQYRPFDYVDIPAHLLIDAAALFIGIHRKRRAITKIDDNLELNTKKLIERVLLGLRNVFGPGEWQADSLKYLIAGQEKIPAVLDDFLIKQPRLSRSTDSGWPGLVDIDAE